MKLMSKGMPFNSIFLIVLVIYSIKLGAIENSTKTLLGMHDTIGGEQADGFEKIAALAKVGPSIWSSDFGFSSTPNDSYRRRDDLLAKALLYHKLGKKITLSYHQCNPLLEEPCNFEKGVYHMPLTENQWHELLTDNSPLNLRWKSQWKKIVPYLQEMEKNGISILFRPYHESNIPGFWWASEKPENSIALWRKLHKLLRDEYQLKKISWVWSVSFHPKYWKEVKRYYPGNDVVDVIGVDIYPPHKNSSPDFKRAWDDLATIGDHKKVALTEVSKLPSDKELQMHPWYYVVPWGINMLKKENNEEEIKNFYGHR